MLSSRRAPSLSGAGALFSLPHNLDFPLSRGVSRVGDLRSRMGVFDQIFTSLVTQAGIPE